MDSRTQLQRFYETWQSARTANQHEPRCALEIKTPGMIVSYGVHPAANDPHLKHELHYWPSWGGFDIGRSVHPSSLSVLLPATNPLDDTDWRFFQVCQFWLDGWPYVAQVQAAKLLIQELGIQRICYDSTGRELTALQESGQLPAQFKPVRFDVDSKQRLASRLNFALEEGRLGLLQDERLRRSLLQVNAMLQSTESSTGEHGDGLWSLALALEAALPRFMVRPGMIRGIHG